MNYPKLRFPLLILELIATTCHAEIIIETSKTEGTSNLVEAAVKILRSCYESRVNTIGVGGNSTATLIATLSSDKPFSVILLDDASRSVNNGNVKETSRLQIFAFATSSATELAKSLVMMKNSRWWNHLGQFYIIDASAKENGCTGVYEILSTAWKMNLLEAKFICVHKTKGRLIYSFNPYKSNAPKPWKLGTIYRGENNHPWALFVREYRENEEICDNMDFDKTKDLDGYEIRSAVELKKTDIHSSVSNTNTIGGLNSLRVGMVKTLSRSLNATVKLIMKGENESPGYQDREGKYRGFLGKTVNGISDIELLGRFHIFNSTVKMTYPHYQSGLAVVTQYRGDKSQLGKLMSVLDFASRIGVCVVLLVTLIALKYIVRQTSATAVLNVIRIICNGSITNLRDNVASRMYLSSLLLFVVTIQGIYQGQFASILSKREPLKNVNTKQDLVESDHTIYCPISYRPLLNDPVFEARKVEVKEYDCVDYVLEDSSAACVTNWKLIIPKAARSKLHLSSELVVKNSVAWVIRSDWPLEHRVNIVVQGLIETGILPRWYVEEFEKPLRIIEANDIEDKDRTHKILTLNDISFAFAILVIGLGCATIIFIFEIAIERLTRSRIVRTRRRFQHQFRSINRRVVQPRV